MGRKCAVPHCYSGYRKCKEKASLYKVPDDDFFLSKWQEAIAREDRPITPRDYVCDKHFKEDDIQRTRVIKNMVEVYLRPKLRPDAIPSIFPDLPEFILKMVKKRRKMLPQDIMKKESKESTNGSCNVNGEVCETELKEERDQNERELAESTNDISNNEIDIKSENEESFEKEQDFADEDPLRSKFFKCDECDYETRYLHNLHTHHTKHRTGEEAYIHCEICQDYKTKWKLTYRNHMKIKHGVGFQEIFNCTLCDYKTRVKICLKRHSDRHKRDLLVADKIKYEFPNCNYESDSKTSRRNHSLIHSKENENKAFKCTECHYGTNSKTHILKHIKSAHKTGDDTVVSIDAKKSEESTLKRRRPKTKPLYKCVKCMFQTNYHAVLLKHLIKHKERTDHIRISKIWKCSKCPYATFFQLALESHQKADCKRVTFIDQGEEGKSDKEGLFNESVTKETKVSSVNDSDRYQTNFGTGSLKVGSKGNKKTEDFPREFQTVVMKEHEKRK